jgi:hypothetical protein
MKDLGIVGRPAASTRRIVVRLPLIYACLLEIVTVQPPTIAYTQLDDAPIDAGG